MSPFQDQTFAEAHRQWFLCRVEEEMEFLFRYAELVQKRASPVRNLFSCFILLQASRALNSSNTLYIHSMIHFVQHDFTEIVMQNTEYHHS